MKRVHPGATAKFVREVFSRWMAVDVARLGAALAFYTVFALAPLFVIALALASVWFGEEAARRELLGQVAGLVGREGGEAIQSIVGAAKKPGTGTFAAIVASLTLFAGASGVFVQLQGALNTVWNVPPATSQGLFRFVKKRLLSLGMVLGIGFLLLVSLILSAGLAALGKFVGGFIPAQQAILEAVNFLASLATITIFFAMIFKVLPDVKIAWGEVWMAGFITAILFNVGKLLLGFYLGRSAFASAYGAAGSLVILLVWVYYSAQILLLGATITYVRAGSKGSNKDSVHSATLTPVLASTTRQQIRTE